MKLLDRLSELAPQVKAVLGAAFVLTTWTLLAGAVIGLFFALVWPK